MQACVQSFYEKETGSLTHVVYDQPGGHCAIVDPVLDYDPASARTATASADAVLAFVGASRLAVDWILETHAHADHLSGADYLRGRTGARVAIGSRIGEVQREFRRLLDWGVGEPADGSQFDHLFEDGEPVAVGTLPGRALHVPGHTPASVAYQFGDCAFIGDLLLRPAMGSARCDFPGGDARELYRSARRLLDLPAATRLFLCHDYPDEGEAPVLVTTVAEQRQANVHLHEGVGEQEFVALRSARDQGCALPRLFFASLQVNLRGGRLPPPAGNGVRYLELPLDAF